jgi:hypothetical protein
MGAQTPQRVRRGWWRRRNSDAAPLSHMAATVLGGAGAGAGAGE